jgi:hypothetical protein
MLAITVPARPDRVGIRRLQRERSVGRLDRTIEIVV